MKTSLFAMFALIAMASSAAVAQPRHHRHYADAIDNVEGPLYTGWIGNVGRGDMLVPLTEPTRIEVGREDFVVKQGGFDVIQLRGTHGSTYIAKVTIDFGEGIPAQIVNVNRWLDAGEAFSIDVRGRRDRGVNRIFVYGTSRPRSAYQLFAR
jgi:hypothetical protein